MKLNKEDKKKLGIGVGAFIVILILVFVYGKMKGRNENEQREIDVTVDIKDQNGQTTTYDPNELLVRLNKGLTTTYVFGTSERCKPIEELLELDSVRFMATIKAYEEKYGTSIVTHMRACWRSCTDGWNNHFTTIETRIDNLKDIIQ